MAKLTSVWFTYTNIGVGGALFADTTPVASFSVTAAISHRRYCDGILFPVKGDLVEQRWQLYGLLHFIIASGDRWALSKTMSAMYKNSSEPSK